MPLTVEDGSGNPNADAFVSVTDCDAYCAAHGLTGWTGMTDTTLKENAIRRATGYLSFSLFWKGSRTHARAQALAWPRAGATDIEGWVISANALPVELVQACCEIAAREVVTPGFTSPDVTMTERVRLEKVGEITTEYASVPTTSDAARPVMTRVMDLIGGFLATGSNGLVGAAVRG